MYQIQQVTSDPLQEQSFVLPDGTSFTLRIAFVPMQYGWFIIEFTYGDFQIKGFRISVSPNMLYQFKNKLPFGLACLTATRREPTQQEDFSSGTFKLYVLEEIEMEEFAEILSGQVSS